MESDSLKSGGRDRCLIGSQQSCEPASHITSSKNTTLQALTSAALVLPGLLLPPAQAANVGADSFSFQYSRFQEGKRKLFTVPNSAKPIEAEVIHASGNLSLTDRIKFSFNYTRDTWSGATPVTTAPLATNGNRPILRNLPSGVVVTGASPFVNTRILLDRQLNPIRQDALTGQIIGKDTRAVEILSSASPETRNAADFKLGYEWNEAALDIGGGLSLENDFESRYGNMSGRLDFNQKLTSLKLGLGYTSSDISAILDNDIVPYLTRTAFASQIKSRGGSEILHGSRQDWTSHFGLTQILSKHALIDANIDYTHSTGFMENPYKAMTVIFVDPASLNDNQNTPIVGDVRALIEQRPNIRNQLAISTKYIQYISKFDAALHLNYKFTYDDWGINTNTLSADWIQPLGGGWTLTPRVRYYSQDAASFYQPYLFSQQSFSSQAVDQLGRQIWVDVNNPDMQFVRDENFNLLDSNGNLVDESLLNVQPKTDTFDANKLPDNFSSDHRLSGFGSLSGGFALNKTFVKGIELEAGFEYYTRASSLKLGGSGGTGFADFDYYVANAVIKINVEQLNFSTDDNHHRSHSDHNSVSAHHHGEHGPAGLMYSHMLDKAGDFMFGYHFMYSRQAGDMLRGSHPASDQMIVDLGCSDSTQCRFTPTYMNMNMHMLNIMYAPTDWLNVMLMPNFIDMDMNLRALSGRPAAIPGIHEHTGIAGHATGGVGDTVMSSLVKLYATSGHQLHMGLGLSAPTGNVDLELRRIFQIDGGLIHFGMQLGSGTWDFLPSLTYTGHSSRWSWGAQLNGVKRMEEQNKSGYRLGDMFQATTWGGYRLNRWLSASIRGIYTLQGAIKGDFNVFNARIGPMDFPTNQGGQYWDIGFGLNVSVPSGKFVGNSLGVEWLQPLRDDVNGFQLERKGALAATWGYSF